MDVSVVILRYLHRDVKVILCLLDRHTSHVNHVRRRLANLPRLVLLLLLATILKSILIENRLLHLPRSYVLESLRRELLTEFIVSLLPLEGG